MLPRQYALSLIRSYQAESGLTTRCRSSSKLPPSTNGEKSAPRGAQPKQQPRSSRSETAMAEITVGDTVEKKFPGFGVYQGTVESIQDDTCLVRWRCAEPEDPTTLSLAEAAKCLVRKAPMTKKKATKKPAPKRAPPTDDDKPSKKSKKDPPNAQQLANAPGDASCAAEVRTGLKKVEAYAQNWLSKHKKDDAPSGDEVVTMLKLLNGKWPTQARPNVTDTGRPVPGMCAGLVFALGQGARTSLISTNHPNMTKVLVKWCRATLPKTKKGAEFPFSSLQVNYNYAAKKHVDGNNIGPSYIISLGKHTGGNLWTADQGIIECHDQWKLFDGNTEHYTTPFKGERISFIAFAHEQYNKLEAPIAKNLQSLGFTAARSDRKDLEFFARFRIERSYLTEEHNEKFKAELKKRAQKSAPASTLKLHDVAVECYGRQADRGGGWMAFHGINGVETLQLTPNSVGIWCAELQFVGDKLALVSHKRLDFYNKREKATAEFQKQVEKMKDGTPVLLGIADTACAASRPLGQGVYNTLYKLGAPKDMPKIEYRAAWAFIGYKGAKAGTAQHAMGTRSTLLRLDASIPSCGKLVKKDVDNTSIIDVCIGTGQDSAK